MLYSILRFRFSILFVSRFDWLLELSSVPCSLFACSVASEIGRYSRSLVSKSFIKVYRTELLPEPNGPVMAMFLMFCSSATLKALFKSSTVLYEASFLDSFLGSKVLSQKLNTHILSSISEIASPSSIGLCIANDFSYNCFANEDKRESVFLVYTPIWGD